MNIIASPPSVDMPTTEPPSSTSTVCRASEEELTRFRREHVSFVFQFYNLTPSLTVLENVSLVTEISRRPLDPREALPLVGLSERIPHFPALVSMPGP